MSPIAFDSNSRPSQGQRIASVLLALLAGGALLPLPTQAIIPPASPMVNICACFAATAPTGLDDVYPAWSGSLAFMFGGNQGASFSNRVRVFDPSGPSITFATPGTIPLTLPGSAGITHVSAAWANPPLGLYTPLTGSACAGGCAYAFGGIETGTIAVRSIYQFDPATGTVVLVNTLPTTLVTTAAVYDGNRYAYVIGGKPSWAPTAASASIVRFDTWFPDLPTSVTTLAGVVLPHGGLSGMAAAWDGARIWIFGGTDSFGTVWNDVTVVDPTGAGVVLPGSWGPLPYPDTDAAVFFDGADFYVFGGHFGATVYATTVRMPGTGAPGAVYNPGPADLTPTGLYDVGAFYDDCGTSYVLGGESGGAHTKNVYRFGNAPGKACHPPPEYANCRADGLVIEESDALGGSSRTAYAESIANATSVPGALPPPHPTPAPPVPAQAHADAKMQGVHYANSVLSVDAKTVHSRCDVDAVDDRVTGGFLNDAYGQGGVEDLTVTVGATTLHLEMAEYELEAQGTVPTTSAWDACKAVEVSAPSLPFKAAVCHTSTLATCTGLLGTVCGLLLADRFGKTYGPTSSATGARHYTGDFAVLVVATPSATTIVRIGHVEVTVDGGPGTPPAYVPNTGCAPALVPCT